MSIPRMIQYEYARDAESVAALLIDPSFLRRRCEAAGERNIEVTVEALPDGLRVVVARDRDVALPAFAKRMFEARSRVTDDTRWRRQGDSWVSDYAIHIQGVPGAVRGTSSLVPKANGCHYESSFEVTSHVALFKSKVEDFLADRVEESLRANAERNAEALSA